MREERQINSGAVNMKEFYSEAERVEVKPAIGKKEIEKALALLNRYKQGKANLENEVVENELWYKLRHWEVMRQNAKEKELPEPSSAWLFNSLAQKHADAMDNFPEPNVLPREQSDEEEAKKLSAILPVVLEHCDFENTYSENWWEKLKHGTSVYGVFWNSEKENGLGDIDIVPIDLLNIFWEPGIRDVQESSNLFIVTLKDREQLRREYPKIPEGSVQGGIAIKEYIYDDTVDTSDKVAVIDWYYKVKDGSGTHLHYCKFSCGEVLFASENEEEYRESGWYEHGKYPVVFDTLFPEKGTCCGFGYISICKDPQMYIDKLSKYILQNAFMASKIRYMVSDGSGINEDEFKDWSNDVVHCSGNINEDKAQQIKPQPLSGIYYNILQFKTDELKETSSNRDFSQGSTASGVTAAAAIAALQEAGSKTSRDMIAASYRAYTTLCYMVIDLMCQFYDEERAFRITGEGDGDKYIAFSNAGIREQTVPPAYEGAEESVRRPVFDIKIKAQKKNPFSRMSQNELAKELLGLGFFAPQNAHQALCAIELMEFEGKDKVTAKIKEGATLQSQINEMQMQMQQMAAMIEVLRSGEGAMQGDKVQV